MRLTAADEVHLARALSLYERRLQADGMRLPPALAELLDVFGDTGRHAATDLAGEVGSGDGELVSLVLFEVDEVAARLRVSARTVERLIEAGSLPAVKVSPRETRVRPADLEAYIAQLEPLKGAA